MILFLLTITWLTGIASGCFLYWFHAHKHPEPDPDVTHLRDTLAWLIMRHQYLERRLNEVEIKQGEGREIWQ